MELKSIFNFLLVLILLSLFTACGVSSSGVFEKRKHLKGWHFNKKTDFSKKGDETALKEHAREEQNEKTGKKVTPIKEVEVRDLIAENIVDLAANTEGASYVAYTSTVNSKQIIYKNDIIETPQENYPESEPDGISNDADEPEEVKKEFLYSIWIRILGVIGLVYVFFGIFGFVAVIGLLPYFFGASILLGIPLWIAGGYFALAIFIFLTLLLFVREDGELIWTFAETLRKIALIYFIAAVIAGGIAIYAELN